MHANLRRYIAFLIGRQNHANEEIDLIGISDESLIVDLMHDLADDRFKVGDIDPFAHRFRFQRVGHINQRNTIGAFARYIPPMVRTGCNRSSRQTVFISRPKF